MSFFVPNEWIKTFPPGSSLSWCFSEQFSAQPCLLHRFLISSHSKYQHQTMSPVCSSQPYRIWGDPLPLPAPLKALWRLKSSWEEQELLPTSQNPINCHGSSMKGQGNGTRSVPESTRQWVLWNFSFLLDLSPEGMWLMEAETIQNKS